MEFWIHSSMVMFEGTQGYRKINCNVNTVVSEQIVHIRLYRDRIRGQSILVTVGSRRYFVAWSDKQILFALAGSISLPPESFYSGKSNWIPSDFTLATDTTEANPVFRCEKSFTIQTPQSPGHFCENKCCFNLFMCASIWTRVGNQLLGAWILLWSPSHGCALRS